MKLKNISFIFTIILINPYAHASYDYNSFQGYTLNIPHEEIISYHKANGQINTCAQHLLACMLINEYKNAYAKGAYINTLINDKFLIPHPETPAIYYKKVDHQEHFAQQRQSQKTPVKNGGYVHYMITDGIRQQRSRIYYPATDNTIKSCDSKELITMIKAELSLAHDKKDYMKKLIQANILRKN